MKNATESVMTTIEEHNLLGPGDSVLVAVSGGADSVALVHILNGVAPVYGLKLAVAHVNHSLRGSESDGDQAFVENLAESLGLCCHTGRKDVNAWRIEHKLSTEEAARNLRHAFLMETAERYGYQKIATAHHADDNAELFLMNLFRGSGSSGLKAMGARGLKGRIIRPFIDIGKEAILAYVREKGLEYRSDSSNWDRSFLRNRVRHDLLPLLDRCYQNGISNILTRTAKIIGDDAAWIDECVEAVFIGSIAERNPTGLALSMDALKDQHRAVLRRVIRKAMAHVKKDLRRITFAHTEAVCSLMHSEKAFASLDLPDRLRVLKKDGLLCFRIEKKALRQVPPTAVDPVSEFSHCIEAPGNREFELKVRGTPFRFVFSEHRRENLGDMTASGPMTAFVDMDRLRFPLVLRNTAGTDRFRPLGMNGHKNAPLYVSLPGKDRKQRYPGSLLLSGDRVVWVCGHRIDDSFKLGPSTEKVLKVELFLD